MWLFDCFLYVASVGVVFYIYFYIYTSTPSTFESLTFVTKQGLCGNTKYVVQEF